MGKTLAETESSYTNITPTLVADKMTAAGVPSTEFDAAAQPTSMAPLAGSITVAPVSEPVEGTVAATTAAATTAAATTSAASSTGASMALLTMVVAVAGS